MIFHPWGVCKRISPSNNQCIKNYILYVYVRVSITTQQNVSNHFCEKILFFIMHMPCIFTKYLLAKPFFKFFSYESVGVSKKKNACEYFQKHFYSSVLNWGNRKAIFTKQLLFLKTKNQIASIIHFICKVGFFVQCTKMQLITLQNFNNQTCFSLFFWFFSLKCWFKGQIISRIHLSLSNAYKLMCFDRNINGNKDVKCLECD